MHRVLIIMLLLSLLVFQSLGEDGWVVGLKSGAGAGLIGLEVEREWAGFGVWLAAGTS